jgi:uncharacterized protein
LRVVLDTCVLKLATLPNPINPAALIAELGLRRSIDLFASPAILVEYGDVLDDTPEFLARLTGVLELCYPLTTLRVVRHEPDNRFVECALACEADYLVTVNTARGHFDRPRYGPTRVLTPRRYADLDSVAELVRRLPGAR